MKKIEVLAYSLEEAKKKVMNENGIKVVHNVTITWKNQGSPISGKDLETFCVEMLDKHRISDVKGAGLMFVVTPGSRDTRERPYKLKNIVNAGKRSIERVFEVRLSGTNEVVGKAKTKGEATKLAKSLMSKYRQDMYSTIVYHVKEGKDVAFELTYTPAASTQEGRYIVFGNEADNF